MDLHIDVADFQHSQEAPTLKCRSAPLQLS